MDSDDWNTVYVSHIDNDIAVYYGPFANKLAKKDDVKVPNLAAENIQALEEFQTRLFNILEKHVNTTSTDVLMPYIGIRVFNQYHGDIIINMTHIHGVPIIRIHICK
jgi:hypothetical protein